MEGVLFCCVFFVVQTWEPLKASELKPGALGGWEFAAGSLLRLPICGHGHGAVCVAVSWALWVL